ncbi:MAG: hypothetical protein K1Y01_10120 [Vicinamibacteria bacterium]|nr:hypothetical protein [Vicinamibacteria bacterium]
MTALALAAGLTVISASNTTAAPSWTCPYAAERLPRALALRGDDTVSAMETRTSRKGLSLPDGALSRASALSLARALGGSKLVVVRCQDDRDQTVLEAQAFEVDLPIAGVAVRVARPRAEVGAAIDELAARLTSASAPDSGAGFRAPSPGALARAGSALASPNALDRARGLAAALDVDPASVDLRLSAVEAAIEARDFDAAIRLATAPPSPDTPGALSRVLRFLAGAAQLEAGRYVAASETFGSLLRTSETAAVLNNLGVARFRLRDPDASSLFSRAGSFADDRQNDISFNRALAMLFEGKAEQALPVIDRAIEAAPGDAQTHLLKVWAFRALNREPERATAWDRLMAVAPSFASLGTPDLARRLERIFLSERAHTP